MTLLTSHIPPLSSGEGLDRVRNIEKIAYKLLPFAEEYGLIDLRMMCEEVLSRSLANV